MATGLLTNFLNETGRAWRDAAAERATAIADWRAAVRALQNTIRGWVEASDPDRLLQLTETEIELIEFKLGKYRLPALTIALGARQVHVVPVARYSGGVLPASEGTNRVADGSVVLSTTRQVSAAAADYRLSRAAGPAGDRWYVSTGGPPDTEFTSEAFERILVGLMR